MLGHKTSFNKFKTEIISIFSDHNGMKLEINPEKIKTEMHTEIWRLNNMLLKINVLTMRSTEISEDNLKQMKMRTQERKICGT